MCLAVPAKIIEIEGDKATFDVRGNRVRGSVLMVPGAAAGDYVLLHAGFAITTIDEADALATYEVLDEAFRRAAEPDTRDGDEP